MSVFGGLVYGGESGVSLPGPPDPLGVFGSPPVDPPDLLSEVPPYERGAYEVQAVLRAVANELGRIEAVRQALIENFFPGTANALLPFFERLLGLAADPPGVTLDARQALATAAMARLGGQGSGLEWEAAVTGLVGAGWSYQEHDPADLTSPPAYTIAMKIPSAMASAWPVIREITPAHVDIVEGYSDGFFVGITAIGSDL